MLQTCCEPYPSPKLPNTGLISSAFVETCIRQRHAERKEAYEEVRADSASLMFDRQRIA